MLSSFARFALGASLAFVVGCGSDDSPGPTASPPACGSAVAKTSVDGIVLSDACGDEVKLLPRALVGGAWHGGGADGACTQTATSVACPAGDAGTVHADLDPAGDVVVTLDASRDATVGGLSLDGAATLPGARSWLSNGFQSWSETGMVALAPTTSDDALSKALSARGDGEVLRDGTGVSWTFTYVGGGPGALFAGARTAKTFKPWIAPSLDADGTTVRLRIASGGAGEQVPVVAGASIAGETFRIALGDGLAGVLASYGASLATHRTTSNASAAVGWNSWYQLWDGVDEAAIVANEPLAKEALAPWLGTAAGPPRIVIDDGWERAWGDWEPNAKFPSGIDGLAKKLADQGDTVGIWFAPLLASATSDVATLHPDWFLPGVSYQHAKDGTMLVLDVTNPDAAAHLASVVETIVGWGITLLKIDFLFAGTWEATRATPMTGMQAYARALDVIRKAAGDATTIVAVGAPDVATFPYADGWRVGPDIALETSDVTWPNVANEARSVASRWPFCEAVLCDPDPVLLRKLTHDEVDAGGWVVALAGGALFLSDDLRVLPAERRTWGLDADRARAALGGSPAVPADPFPADPPTSLANPLVDIVQRRTAEVVPQVFAIPGGPRVLLNVADADATIDGIAVPAHAARIEPASP